MDSVLGAPVSHTHFASLSLGLHETSRFFGSSPVRRAGLQRLSLRWPNPTCGAARKQACTRSAAGNSHGSKGLSGALRLSDAPAGRRGSPCHHPCRPARGEGPRDAAGGRRPGLRRRAAARGQRRRAPAGDLARRDAGRHLEQFTARRGDPGRHRPQPAGSVALELDRARQVPLAARQRSRSCPLAAAVGTRD